MNVVHSVGFVFVVGFGWFYLSRSQPIDLMKGMVLDSKMRIWHMSGLL